MSDLPAARPLAELATLDPALLYVFVAGPGTGEGIAVALPGCGWLLLDGCSCDGPERWPLKAIVEGWRRMDDRVEFQILTHPHTDHAKGFADLMETFDPKVVGLTGIEPSDTDSGLNLAAFTQEPGTFRSKKGPVYEALLAIDARRTERPGQVHFLAAPQPLAINHDQVVGRVCAPAANRLKAVWPNGPLGPWANPLSVVVALKFGQTEVVLAADLPLMRSRAGGLVPTGWAEVMEREPTLAGHIGLKVPHHGSNEAIDEILMAPPSRHRAWAVTPFASSDLPRKEVFGDLLIRQSPIHLTAPSQARRYQAAVEQGLIQPRVERYLQALRGEREGYP